MHKLPMRQSRLFKILSALALLAGAVPLTYCLLYHWCMCGHRAHDSNNLPIDYVVDYSALALIGLGLVFSLWVQGKKWRVYLLIFLSTMLAAMRLSVVALVPYSVAMVLLVLTKPDPSDPSDPPDPSTPSESTGNQP